MVTELESCKNSYDFCILKNQCYSYLELFNDLKIQLESYSFIVPPESYLFDITNDDGSAGCEVGIIA